MSSLRSVFKYIIYIVTQDFFILHFLVSFMESLISWKLDQVFVKMNDFTSTVRDLLIPSMTSSLCLI